MLKRTALALALVLALFLTPAAYPQTVLLGGMGFDDDVVDYGTSLNAALAEDFTAAFNGTWAVEYVLNHSYLLTGDRVVVGANVGPSLAVKTELLVDYTDVGGGRTLVEMTLRLDDVLADAAQMEIPTSAVTVSPDRLTVGAGWQFGGVYAGHFSGTLGEVVLRPGADPPEAGADRHPRLYPPLCPSQGLGIRSARLSSGWVPIPHPLLSFPVGSHGGAI